MRSWSIVTFVFCGFIALIAVKLGTHTSLAAPGQRSGTVLRATLPNGLRVVIVHNSLAPVVATAMNYLVGSDEAPEGFPGTAHAQEHMMFRGSSDLSADQLANIGSAMGGNFNANTREGLTQYLYTVPSEDIDIALRIEASRMRDVSDSQESWDKERGAIEQEVAQDLSSPFYKLYAQMRAKLFAGSFYAHDALGTKPSFDRTSAAMLKSFYEAWYAPNNAILVIVGNVDPRTTLVRVRELFGSIPAKKLPPRPAFHRTPLSGEKLDLATDRPSATQIVALRLPGLDSPDYPALEILSDVLGSQRFDLYGLVVEGHAIEADFSLDLLRQAGMGYAAVSFAADGNADDIDARIRSILTKVAIQGVPAELVAAAKQQERRQAEFQKNSIEGLASVWSDALALYGLPSPEADLARLDKVSVADVNRVARKYLRLDGALSATLRPQSSGRPVAAGSGFGGQEVISLGEARNDDLPAWARERLQRLMLPILTVRPIVSHLPNGLTLIVQPTNVSDTVSIFGHIRNRPEMEEPAGKEGVSLVVDSLLSYGTREHDRVAFQQALDAIGAEEEAGVDFKIKVLAPNFDRATALLAENELRPALPTDAFANIKDQYTAYIAGRNRSPGYLAQRSLRASLFPPADPMQRQANETSIAGLTRDDVVAYHAKVFRPDLTTIVVIGNVTPARVLAVIAREFGGWHADGAPPEVDLPVIPPNQSASLAIPDASRVQDNVTLAQTLALTRSDPDYYPLALGNAVLGGGFYATRLSIDLRKNAGLVYSVSSDLQAGRTRSNYLVRYASNMENVSKAASAVQREIADMQGTPPTLNELLKAKALLIRQIPLHEAGTDEIAHGLLNRADFGLPFDEPQAAARRYIALTPVDVQAAFRKWMRPDDLIRTSQGPVP
jgi:zinc protease